jgi:flagellar motor switch protein FliM
MSTVCSKFAITKNVDIILGGEGKNDNAAVRSIARIEKINSF